MSDHTGVGILYVCIEGEEQPGSDWTPANSHQRGQRERSKCRLPQSAPRRAFGSEQRALVVGARAVRASACCHARTQLASIDTRRSCRFKKKMRCSLACTSINPAVLQQLQRSAKLCVKFRNNGPNHCSAHVLSQSPQWPAAAVAAQPGPP